MYVMMMLDWTVGHCHLKGDVTKLMCLLCCYRLFACIRCFYCLLMFVSLVTARTRGATRLTQPRKSLSSDPWTVYIVLSYITMMVGRMVFCMIITQVFDARFTKHIELILFDAFLDPIKAHVHCFGTFLLHS